MLGQVIEHSWITLTLSILGTGIAVIAGLVHIVWMISRMRAQLDQIISSIEKDGASVWESLNSHQVQLQNHEMRLVKLETIAQGKER